MPTVEINIALEEEIAKKMKIRALEKGEAPNDYLSGLIKTDLNTYQEELAEEGYRLLSEDTRAFAEVALPIACEVWPQWEGLPDEHRQ